ncbi:MAG TPA: DUF3152 domain-containing protein [Candidatus Saccharimonadales bacterium]|nr:DUF3152 domain-containing protein [Candidatus Saccharimonadales bacterium]
MIDKRSFDLQKAAQPGKQKSAAADKKRKILLIALGVFVFANILMAITYHSKVLPHYYLGQYPIGGMDKVLLKNTPSEKILPAAVVLKKDDKTYNTTPAKLGISVDKDASLQNVQSWIRWVPVISLISVHHVALSLHIDEAQFTTSSKTIETSFYYPASDKYIVFNGADFDIAPAHGGHKVNTDRLLGTVTSSIQGGKTTITVPTTAIAVTKTGADLTGSLQQLQQKLNIQLAYDYHGQKTIPSKTDIGSWYVQSGQGMVPSMAKITAYVNSVGKKHGVIVANPSDIATATMYALTNSRSQSMVIVPQTANTFIRSYCTNVTGVNANRLASLNGKLAAVYNDPRGWNDSGTIAFKHVASGCQYTVWLSAANLMGTFGSICDDFYNCQVGTNVVLNYDRWANATPPWNKTGGSLDDYRTLMIDHETGHRLGFRDNPTCPGTGQKAPVMMQQSVNLKGCIFNIWPLATEFTQLNKMIGAGATSSITNLQ